MRVVSFHFDYLSPYAYLAWLNLKEFSAENELQVVPRPTLLAGLLNRWGHLGPAEIPPKREFVFRDCSRIAARQNHDLCFPKLHPFNPLTALRLSLAEVSGDRQSEVIDVLFRASWGQGLDLGDDGVVSDALDSIGLDGAAWVAKTKEAHVKERLKQAMAAALEAGVFGVPTFVIEGELFWGNDQFVSMQAFLDGSDPVDEEMRALVERTGPSMVRNR